MDASLLHLLCEREQSVLASRLKANLSKASPRAFVLTHRLAKSMSSGGVMASSTRLAIVSPKRYRSH
jgi:hypothetical protein